MVANIKKQVFIKINYLIKIFGWGKIIERFKGTSDHIQMKGELAIKLYEISDKNFTVEDNTSITCVGFTL